MELGAAFRQSQRNTFDILLREVHGLIEEQGYNVSFGGISIQPNAFKENLDGAVTTLTFTQSQGNG